MNESMNYEKKLLNSLNIVFNTVTFVKNIEIWHQFLKYSMH